MGPVTHLVTATFDPSLARYTPDQTEEVYRRLLERARTLGGVKTAALTKAVPFLPGGVSSSVISEGVQVPSGTQAVSVITDAVSEDYFSTLDVPIVEGRPVADTDRAGAPRVAIVNQLFADKYCPHRSAVGRRFRLEGPARPLQIVGVARRSKYFFPRRVPSGSACFAGRSKYRSETRVGED